MSDWTDAEELSGRREFDAWRFARVDRVVPWDWADMANAEKDRWITRARGAEPGGAVRPPADRTGRGRTAP
ncbi:hypothetical protein GCU56_18745 [Geodermatophilus sabuli]|uniref:Uncharacterized protein n=1 Tax=Geodermatophilus sabuli TaxID=1564158 RepID=A0A7K3W7R2_9ACTN|nr:hypothetical protein [Geodermatophilus sabuli]NEK59897.1 hypothetical protein [Geodermatophilus sabuli]